MKIVIGNKEFPVTLHDNDAAKELTQMLPMTMTMNEHNGNEKYSELPKKLSGRSHNPEMVYAGDLMVWSSNILVLFYKNSSTHYNYIAIGRIDDPSGLSEAVGDGSVIVEYK